VRLGSIQYKSEPSLETYVEEREGGWERKRAYVCGIKVGGGEAQKKGGDDE